VRALGLRTALSLKWQEQNLIIVDSCSVDVIKTGAVDSVIKKIVGDDLVTIIDGETKNSNFELSARNIPRVLYLPQLVCIFGWY
jgi:ribosomal protein, L4/L1 family